MSIPSDKTEFSLWASADERQKSFVVQVLHWFHYRPTRLRASWTQEEVLTWELIRAMDLLPQRLFLRPLLEQIANSSEQARQAVHHLGPGRVAITPYPTLGLGGGKRNCKSDIGLGPEGEPPCIWIEAKTASFKPADLDRQLKQQESAMAQLMPDACRLLITLLPTQRALSDVPNLSWEGVRNALESCEDELARSVDSDLGHGYRALARELKQRIESHPNRAKGWV